MGKNNRHKKNLKAEKAKTKLKASKTKFLPKGLNVTDTNFKIKPIVIQEQLKSHTSEEFLTARKLNLNDLLTRLKHHNTAARFEGCEGLIELVSSCPDDVIKQHLHSLVPGVSRLFEDREQKVRRKAIAVVEKLLEKVPADTMRSCVRTLSLFMACAMTHIDGNVKEDSLLIIDIFLKYGKALIADIFDTILPNFLNLISRLRQDSGLSRTLTMNLGSKMTITKWRIEVLNRLHGILNSVIEDDQEAEAKRYTENYQINAWQVYVYKDLATPNLESYKDASINMANYFDVLLPLLHETVVEVLPLSNQNEAREEDATIIQPDAVAILSCAMEIYYSLYKLMNGKHYKVDHPQMIKLFHSKNSQKFFTHILKQFPFRQQSNLKRKFNKDMNKLMGTHMDVKCLKDNLKVCCIFATLYKTFPNEVIKNKANDILAYLNMCLVNRNYVNAKSVKSLILTLKIIFFDNFAKWTAKSIKLDNLLDSLVHFYEHSDKDVEVFELLGNLVNIGRFSQKYCNWLGTVPTLLLKPSLSLKELNIIVNISRHANASFLTALENKFSEILCNLEVIQFDKEDVQPPLLKLVCMFNYITLDDEKVAMLKEYVERNDNLQVTPYIKNVLLSHEWDRAY